MVNQESEREPLLVNTADDGNHQDTTETQTQEVIVKDSQDVSPLIHSLIAFRSGHLPDNQQLFKLFHSSAAFFDSLSTSITKSLSTAGTPNGYGSTSDQPSTSSSNNKNETVITLAALFKECSTLCRISASWLYGNTKDKDGKITASSDTDGEDVPVNKSGAKGNENEQWQRLIWHLSQTLINGDDDDNDNPLEVEMESELETDFQKAKKEFKKAAKQIKTDSVQGFQSLIKIISFILRSDEFLRIPSDIVTNITQTLAGMANQVGTKAFKAEEVLEADPEAQKETEKDFVYPKEAIQEAAQKTADTVEILVNEQDPTRTTEKGKKKSESQTWEDEFAKRIARLLEEIRENDSSREAVDKFVQLTRKYMNVAREIREDIQVKVEEEGSLTNVVEGEVDKAREGMATKIESTHLNTQISAHLSYHSTATLKALKEVLEGLSGGTSLDNVIESGKIVKEQIQSDSELRQWVEKVLDLIADGTRPESSSSKNNEKSIEEQIQDLFNELHTLLNTRPSIVRSWEDFERNWTEFKEALYSDKMMKQFYARIQHIIGMTKTVFVKGGKDAKNQLKNAFSTILYSLIPSIGQILSKIPLPRVEFSSENLDAVIDDVHLSTVQLLPDLIRLTTKTDWIWQANNESEETNHIDTDFRLFFGGLKFAVKDVSFYVQERFTAPSSNACGQCCSFGNSDSNWCLFRGPSSWFAYTESALLDVGFKGKGIGVILDLRDAGQDVRKQKYEANQSWLNWFWSSSSSNSDDENENEIDQIIKRYQSTEEQAELKESSIRETFFKINDCKIEIDDSFDLNLRNSRHWLINSFFRFTTRPLIKLLLKRIISAQIRNGFIIADKRAFDIHLRAKLVRHRKDYLKVIQSSSTQDDSPKMPLVSESIPSIMDYFSVLIDDEAGKSKERITKERQEKREKEREERKKEEEEIQKQAERQEEVRDQQPKPEKQMEIRPSGLIYHDEEGEYSIALGVKPSGILLGERQHGPKTQRMKIREAIANPKRTAEELGQRGRYIHEEARKALNNERQQKGESQKQNDEDRDLLDVPRAVTKNARESIETAQEAIQAISGNVITTEEEDEKWDRDNGWKSTAFDL